jgi:CheY-like chemotaxis protein
MTKDAAPVRLLLRAEVLVGTHLHEGYTLELGESTMFVRVDEQVPIGELVQVRVSFARVVAPVLFDARVTGHRTGRAPGEPTGLELALDLDDEQAARFAALRALARPPDAPPDGDAEACRVLIVEDSATIRDLMALSMKRHVVGDRAFTVDFAASSEEAWAKLAAADYNLLMVDYFLPTPDGARLVERIRRDPRMGQVPVVAISVGGDQARADMMAAGADLFLDKPLSVRDLLRTLEHVVHAGGRP